MKLFYSFAFLLIASTFSFGQVNLPKQSQKQEVRQTVGDTTVSIVYSRPNVRGRKVWGGLVPYNEVWRAGADENTTVEFTRDVTVDGKDIPAGKYGFHVLPTENEMTLIFSKDNDKWGSFSYRQENDALRLTVKPIKAQFEESLSYSFSDVTVSSAKVSLAWGEIAISFTVDTGDVHSRSLQALRAAISARAGDDIRPMTQGASYVLSFQLKPYYQEAISWLDIALKSRETFALLSSKSRLLAADGMTKDAISVGEKAIAMGKSANPPANTADFERFVTGLKSQQ